MSLVRRHPRGYAAVDPFAGFDSLFESFLRPVRVAASEERHLPATDIHETPAAYEVTAELPGMRKEDIKVSLHEGVLTISAERRAETAENKDRNLVRRERRQGLFLRRFAIGPDVQDDKVDASYEDGVLKLVVPKLQPKAKESRNIDIH